MKTIKNIQLSLQNEQVESMIVKSISAIEKTYFTLVSAAFILTIFNFIKEVLL